MRALAIGALLLLAGLAVAAPLIHDDGQGPGWLDGGPDGHAELVSSLSADRPVRILQDSLAVLPPTAGPGEVAFLFPGHRPENEAERQAVFGFVSRGGLLVLAADGRHVAPWLASVGLKLQGPAALLPPGSSAPCIQAPAPVATTGFLDVCLPSPTVFPALAELRSASPSAGNATPVFLDLDQDGTLSLGDQGPATFPMVVAVPHGEGQVVAIADGDLWRNGHAAPNLAYAAALAEGKRIVYVDASSADSGPLGPWRRPAISALAAADAVQTAALAAIVLGAAGCALFIRSLQPWRSHQTTELREDPATQAEIAAVAESHPPTDL